VVYPYYESALSLGRVLLRGFALALDLPETYFDDEITKPMAQLSLLHYPPQPEPVDPKHIGIGAHTDFECFTILAQSAPGLQIQNNLNEWIEVPLIPGAFVINIGECMARWTNDVFASTIHRVINLTGKSRFSIRFFFGASYNTVITCLESCQSPERPARYAPVQFGEWAVEGIKVEETVIPELSAAITAFLTGQGDVFWSTTADVVQMSGQDPSVRSFFLVDYSDGGDGILGRNINGPEDVKGQTIATNNLLSSRIILRAYLQSLGLTEADVVFQNIPSTESAAAFTAKRVDIAFSTAPWMVTAAQEGDGEIIFSTKGTNLIADVLITRQEVLDTRKSELQAYVRAVDRGVKLVNAGDPEALRIVAEKIGVDIEQVQEQLALVKLFDIEGNKTVGFNPDNHNSLIKNLEVTAQVAYDSKIISKPLDVSTLYDDSVVNSL
jgi:NitT/TauT family transport system substrate-binding protein